MQTLPLELVVSFGRFLPVKDFFRLTMTCKAFQSLKQPKLSWTLYDQSLQEDIPPRFYPRLDTGNLFGLEYRKMVHHLFKCEQVETLLQVLQDMDPTRDNDLVLFLTSRYAQVKVLAYLLQHPRVDPTLRDDHILRMAANQGDTQVMELVQTLMSVTMKNDDLFGYQCNLLYFLK